MNNLHTFGDSHSVCGWNNEIQRHHLGPVLCYSFGKEKLNRCDIRNFNIKDGDTIVFCLGEIDCRCHIHKHITKTTTYQDIINNIVNNYFDAIELNVSISQIKLKNVCVFNVPPPIEKYKTFTDGYPETIYPHLGSDNDRKQYTLYFNEKLKDKCIEHKYIFFDVYKDYVDSNGFLRKDLSDGTVPIGNGIHLDNFIKYNLL